MSVDYCPKHKKQPFKYIGLLVRENEDHSIYIRLPYCELCGHIEINLKQLKEWFITPQE